LAVNIAPKMAYAVSGGALITTLTVHLLTHQSSGEQWRPSETLFNNRVHCYTAKN